MKTIDVAMHCHSSWSYDARWTLAELAEFFGRRGIDAVLMSEHDTGFDPSRWQAYRDECAAASTARCRLIPGIEYSSPDNDIHILTWGLERFLAEHRPVRETLEAVASLGGVAVFAHPQRRDAWAKFDPAWIELLSGIELWNRKTDGIAPARQSEALIAETGLSATVAIDFHSPRHFWPLTHRIAVGDDWEGDILAAVRAGNLDCRVAGARVLGPDGRSDVPLSRAAEQLRRGLRTVRDKVTGR
jgi:predicted metal-dependent phosphoesterase TrpH